MQENHDRRAARRQSGGGQQTNRRDRVEMPGGGELRSRLDRVATPSGEEQRSRLDRDLAAVPGCGVLGERLGRGFYARNALEVAPELLNKVLVTGDGRAGRIVEVEAYRGADDPGSHGYNKPTRRNRTMFGPPGHLYVYFTYGMHWCSNVVVETDGTCAAVLLRALTPLRRLQAMHAARGPAASRRRDLCSGPAKLTQALGIDGRYDGADLVTADRGVTVIDDGCDPPAEPVRTTRIGLSKGSDLPWRWYVPGVADISRK